MQEMNKISVPSKSMNVLMNRQGISRSEIVITLGLISTMVGIFAYLSIPYVQDARNVMAIANCRNVYVTAEICLNNPKQDLTFEEQLEEELGNDAEVNESDDQPSQYTGEFAAGEIEVNINDSEVTYVSWISHDYEGVAACWTPEEGYESIE